MRIWSYPHSHYSSEASSACIPSFNQGLNHPFYKQSQNWAAVIQVTPNTSSQWKGWRKIILQASEHLFEFHLHWAKWNMMRNPCSAIYPSVILWCCLWDKYQPGPGENFPGFLHADAVGRFLCYKRELLWQCGTMLDHHLGLCTWVGFEPITFWFKARIISTHPHQKRHSQGAFPVMSV